MNRWQDISISDASLKAEFITKFFNGNYIDAFTIISNNPQLNTKAFVADTINQIATILLSLENNFQNGVIDYLSQQYSNFQNIIDNYNLKGNWSSSTIYQIYNFVTYNNIDYLYINLTPSSGNLPTNTDYWVEINIQGEKGAPGLGVNLQYNWSATTPYNALDVVYYNNALWVARVANINKIPGSTEEWETLSGSIVSFYNDGDIEISNLSVAIEPVQDLHGQDAPYPPGGGKNKYRDTLDGWIKPVNYWIYPVSLPEGTYKLSARLRDGKSAVTGIVVGFAKNGTEYADFDTFKVCVNLSGGADSPLPFTIASSDSPKLVFYGTEAQFVQVMDAYEVQLELGSTATAWTPYSNICPISGWDAVSIWNKPTHDTTLPPTVEIQLGQTVYGGTLDVTYGTLTVDRAMVDLGTLAWLYRNGLFDASISGGKLKGYATGEAKAVCTEYVQRAKPYTQLTDGEMAFGTGYVNSATCSAILKNSTYTSAADFKSAMSGVMLVYDLATPITIQLDPMTISTISGQTNNVWADAGDVTVELDKKYWEEFIKFKLASIYTDYIEPSADSLYNGLIWFEVFNPQTWNYLTNKNYTWNQINANNDTWESVDRGDY